MHRQNSLILFFVILMFASFAYSAPPFQESVTAAALTVVYPKIEYVQKDSLLEFHIHTANASGAAITNNKYNCFGHFYSPTNEHILIKNFTVGSNSYDREVTLNATVNSELGLHQYNIFCNSTYGWGFVSGSYEITNTGKKELSNNINWLTLFFVIAFISIIFTILSVNIKEKKLLEVKLLFFIIGILNAFLAVLIPIGISINPFDINSFDGIIIAYFSSHLLLMLLFIWLYGKHLIINVFKNEK